MSNRLSAAIESTTSKVVQPAMGHAAKLMKLPLANGFRWARSLQNTRSDRSAVFGRPAQRATLWTDAKDGWQLD